MADSQQVQGRPGEQDGEHGGPAPHVEGDHTSHGHSVAAWTAVGVIMLGALVMCVAVVVASAVLFWAGAVVAVLGAISGKVLSIMGFGASGRPSH
jgi:hypothetical protein